MTLWEGYSNERCPNESESLIGEGRGEVTKFRLVNYENTLINCTQEFSYSCS
jgi:hypothetical protein